MGFFVLLSSVVLDFSNRCFFVVVSFEELIQRIRIGKYAIDSQVYVILNSIIFNIVVVEAKSESELNRNNI